MTEPTEKQWWLYLVQCRNGSLYAGIAIDVDARFEAHRAGEGAKYTRAHGAVAVVYRRLCGTKSQALKAEIELKKLTRSEKLAMVRAFKRNAVA